MLRVLTCFTCFALAARAQFPAGEAFLQHEALAGGEFPAAASAAPTPIPAFDDSPFQLRLAKATARDRQGQVWYALPIGLARRASNGAWKLFTRHDGLPHSSITALAAAPDGSLWIGTTQGAIRFDGEHWEYRAGLRWLPDNHVQAIHVDASNTAYFRTPKGVSRIAPRRITLGEKARRYEEAIDARHRRTPYGYVLEVQLARPGDTANFKQSDSDNDGLWTAMYGAGECFAFAATKDDYFRRRARQAFDALKFLMDVTQGGTPPAPPGFAARTILPIAGPDPNQHPGYTREGDQRKQQRDGLWKILQPRWGRSADGQWWWKTDTSSDELDGHYFFYAVYHDLVADAPEKLRVKKAVEAMTDHLLDHGFNYIDHDGRPTRWGVFAPKMLNGDRNWWEERGLNSLSILTYLKIAHHVTGAAKYQQAFDTLIRDHGYQQNAMYAKPDTATGGGNQSDDEMAFMNYYNLVRLEKDPRHKQMWARSLAAYWQHEKAELNPFFAYTAEAMLRDAVFQDNEEPRPLSLQGAALPGALDTLRRYPLDLVNWRMTNSTREDLVPLANGRVLRRNGLVLPADERYFSQLNHDPYRADSGGDGRTLAAATPYLLGYYLGLYHGYVR